MLAEQNPNILISCHRAPPDGAAHHHACMGGSVPYLLLCWQGRLNMYVGMHGGARSLSCSI